MIFNLLQVYLSYELQGELGLAPPAERHGNFQGAGELLPQCSQTTATLKRPPLQRGPAHRNQPTSAAVAASESAAGRVDQDPAAIRGLRQANLHSVPHASSATGDATAGIARSLAFASCQSGVERPQEFAAPPA